MRFLLLIGVLLLSASLCGQGFQCRYYYPGAGTCETYGIFETGNQDYIGCGLSHALEGSVPVSYLTLLGISSSGSVTWTKRYGSAQRLFVTNPLIRKRFFQHKGNYFYTGCVRKTWGWDEGVLMKFSAQGDTVWSRSIISNSFVPIPEGMAFDSDDNIYVSGHIVSQIPGGGEPGLLIKFSADGTELWRKVILHSVPGLKTINLKTVVTYSPTGQIIAGGYRSRYGSMFLAYEGYFVVLDSLGEKVSEQVVTPSPNEGAIMDMINTTDGNIAYVGTIKSPQIQGQSQKKYSMAQKFNPATANQAIWRFDNYGYYNGSNQFTTLCELQDSSLLAAGIIDTLKGNPKSQVLSRYTWISAGGNVNKTIYKPYTCNHDPDWDEVLCVNSINATSDGGFVCAIELFASDTVTPFLFVKYDSQGCDSSIAYCKNPTNVNTQQTPATLKLYPNPVRDLLYVQTGRPVHETCELSIYDSRGGLLRKNIFPAEQNRPIPVSDLRPGTYLLVLESAGGRSRAVFVKE